MGNLKLFVMFVSIFSASASSFAATPLWGNSPRVVPWTQVVKRIVHNRFRDFDAARDADYFCPGYSYAAQSEKENCWLMVISALSKYESGFKTGDAFREPTGQSSIGLMALSPGECQNAPKGRDLVDPIKNLVCGTNKMAFLIARDHMVDASATGSRCKGAASYWSTLRPKHSYYDKTRNRTLHLGFKREIANLTKNYK